MSGIDRGGSGRLRAISPGEQYRIPKELRNEGPVAVKNQAWAAKTDRIDDISREAGGLPNTCSPVGTGGADRLHPADDRALGAPISGRAPTRRRAELLTEAGGGGARDRLARGGEQRAGLGLALALFECGDAVGDDAGAGR